MRPRLVVVMMIALALLSLLVARLPVFESVVFAFWMLALAFFAGAFVIAAVSHARAGRNDPEVRSPR